MAKMKDGVEALITREQFNSLKKMDRSEAESFLKSVYEKGYAKACKDADKKPQSELGQESNTSTADENKKTIDEVISLLAGASGIGPVTLRRIEEALKKRSV